MSWPTLIVVRPAAIGDAVLTSSTVPETPPTAWNSGTTYTAGQQVSIFSGASVNLTTAAVYQSLQNANLNKNPATQTAWWKLLGYTYKAYDAGTTYAVGDRVIDATAHLVYEALEVSTGVPLITEASWAEVGPTNKWAMFDTSNSTQSEGGTQIAVTLVPAGRIDSLGLFNLEASTVRIQSAVAGYDETYDLTEASGIDSWHDWFFEPIVRDDQLIVTDIPPYLSQTIIVTIDNGSATAKAGTLIVGQGLELGMTLEGADSGIVSYSKIDVNQWGDYTLTQRKSVKKVSLQVVVENGDVDRTRRILASFDAVPTIWRGTEDFSALCVYGIYRSFSIGFAYPTQSVCSLDLEGLT